MREAAVVYESDCRPGGPYGALKRVLPLTPMHYDSHQPIINDLEARITTIRDSL